MNKWIGIGRLTRDPEVRVSQGDNPIVIARYALAINRRKSDEQTADFISCVAFGKNAEFAEKYLHKGSKIAVIGRIQTGSYTNKDGERVYTTDIIVEEQEFAESKGADNSQPNSNNTPTSGDGFMNIPDGIEEPPFN